MKRKIILTDPALFVAALLATAIGLIAIFDAGYARSIELDHGAISKEFLSQLAYLPVAGVAFFLCSIVPGQKLYRASKWLWLLTLALLVLVEVPHVGRAMNGSQRWIGLGPLLLQPAEFAKITAVLYLAGVFAARRAWPSKIAPAKHWGDYLDRIAIPKLKRVAPALWVAAAVMLIAKEPDLGTAGVIMAASFAIFAAGGATSKSLIAGVLILTVGSAGLVKQYKYRFERITRHSDRWSEDNMDSTGFQSVKSALAMASGGATGVGVGAGWAKHVLPATTTDFIMATIGEEFGFVGSLLVIGVLAFIALRMLMLARGAPTPFARLTLIGLGSWITIQACVNVMMANGCLPAIGIPLPFISSGGSSLVALWAAIGICQGVLLKPVNKEEPAETGDHRRRYGRPRLSRA